MYLLDTNIVSELRRVKPHGAVLAWLRSTRETEVFVSAVTVGEIQRGIEITRQQDPPRAAELEHWLNLVTDAFGILPMDHPAFREWARLMRRQSDALSEDAMIAAVARTNGLTVATRNVKDFHALEVPLLNPSDYR